MPLSLLHPYCIPLSTLDHMVPHFTLLQWLSKCELWVQFTSFEFSRSVVSDSLQPHGLQHTRLPCSSPAPGACSNSCPSSWWCHPTISSCHPLLLLPSIFPSIRVFSNESVLCIRWPKYWSFSPSSEYSGLISFRIDWLDLLAVQGTLKSLLQHHSLKASIVWCSCQREKQYDCKVPKSEAGS